MEGGPVQPGNPGPPAHAGAGNGHRAQYRERKNSGCGSAVEITMTSQSVARVALTLFVVITGAARPGVAQSPPAASVTVTEAQNGKQVAVPPGGTLLVRLEANRTT